MAAIASFLFWFLLAYSSTIVLTVSQEWTVMLEYSLVDGNEFKPFGSVQLKKNLDGNYTGDFVSSSFHEIAKSLRDESDKSEERTYKLKSGDTFSSNFPENFVASNFGHLIELTVDQNARKILSITHSPYTIEDLVGEELPVEVRVNAIREINGPETVSYLRRMEEEKKARQHGASQDNRSFIQKYWMYFVPVILFMVLSNAFNAEQGQE